MILMFLHTLRNLFSLNHAPEQMIVNKTTYHYCTCGYKKPVRIRIKCD